jgi:agmatinase
MPSTGTPEPGGLRYRQLTTLLDAVSRTHGIVGFDVTELLPQPANRAPDFLAARLVYQIAAYIGRDTESEWK